MYSKEFIGKYISTFRPFPCKYKNNPLNIRYCGGRYWYGCTFINKGFCAFERFEYGVRAALYLLMRSYRKKGICTINDIILRWAPPSENPTDNYISFVQRKVGLQASVPLQTIENYFAVLVAMTSFEQGMSYELLKESSYPAFVEMVYFKYSNDFNFKCF